MDPWVVNFLAYKYFAGILLHGFARDAKLWFHILNIYAPYAVRKSLWERMDCCGLMRMGSPIMMGDLNLTVVSNENWGTKCKLDIMGDYCCNHPVDI